MLKLTRKTEYALIALRHMLTAGVETVNSTREIAIQYHIPYPLMAKIMQHLAKKDIVRPVQGPRGGYLLSANLEKISLTEFFESMEGPLGVMDCYIDDRCELFERCNIRAPIQQINQNLRSMFDNITVYDVAHG